MCVCVCVCVCTEKNFAKPTRKFYLVSGVEWGGAGEPMGGEGKGHFVLLEAPLVSSMSSQLESCATWRLPGIQE